MIEAKGMDLYFQTMIDEGLYSNKAALEFQVKTLFQGIDFYNQRVLDIGGGFGLYSYYAACRGAKRVVCLDPEADGSSKNVTETFFKLKHLLHCDAVKLEPQTLQAFEAEGERFNIILLHNSINHLDETACITLHMDLKSQAIYKQLFSKIYSLASQKAKLIICDCSRYNFYALVKIRNPIVPTVEWHKHQSPQVWIKLLREVGFTNARIKWSSPNRLGRCGQWLFANKLMAYFLASHFRLTMDKP